MAICVGVCLFNLLLWCGQRGTLENTERNRKESEFEEPVAYDQCFPPWGTQGYSVPAPLFIVVKKCDFMVSSKT